MSESDDTDVLLLIPPDIFHVPSESSDLDSSYDNLARADRGVISELVGHMQSLESRISAIESKDNSLGVSVLDNSLDSSQSYNGACRSYRRQTLPRTRFSVSQDTDLQISPVKPHQSTSVPLVPNECSSSQSCTNFPRDDMRRYLPTVSNSTNTNTSARAKHDTLTSYSDSLVMPRASYRIGLSHAMPVEKGSCLSSLRPNDQSTNTSNLYYRPPYSSAITASNLLPNISVAQQRIHSRTVQEMELSKVDELLQEMEATDLELTKKLNSNSGYQYHSEPSSYPISVYSSLTQGTDAVESQRKETQRKFNGISRQNLDFKSCSKESQPVDILSVSSQKRLNDMFPDISLYDDSFQLNETDKIISEFKTWEQSIPQSAPTQNEYTTENANSIKNTDLSNASSATIDNAKLKESVTEQNILRTNETDTNNVPGQSRSSIINTGSILHVSESIKFADATLPKNAEYNNTNSLWNFRKGSQQNGNLHNEREESDFNKNTVHVGTNTDSHSSYRKCQRLLSLSDFWDTNLTRSQEETLRMKLEEEKFRREHCEHLIQELQKRLLEQQEKVAVAVRVDNEKNVLISRFHTVWSTLKQQVEILENKHKSSQINLQNMMEKHHSEVSELQSQVKRFERELSKALDLAAGYKEKSDATTKEKVDLLKTHADELENYKSLVQEAEDRYEQMKTEFNKLLEKNQQTEETLRTVQSELNKEHLREGQVRHELARIGSALDTCEAELSVLKQEKENLQLKLAEELNRNSILEQKNSSLLVSIDEIKKAEKLAKDEIKSVAEEKEKIRAELQEIYQKQVNEVVEAKLQEFQTQLDNAESEFLEELKTRQQVIAECASKKIKDIIDKHRLEINLLEEKHKEEKQLYDLQLAKAVQKSLMLETELSSQLATKSQLAEQLHSVMQKQWEQALHIISGGNKDLSSIQKIEADKSLDPTKGPINTQTIEDLNEYYRIPTTNTLENVSLPNTKEQIEIYKHFEKRLKMIAEMRSAKKDVVKSRNISSPPLICREVPRKHYLKKELDVMSESNITCEPDTEICTRDVSDEVPIVQKATTKTDLLKNKPPWK